METNQRIVNTENIQSTPTSKREGSFMDRHGKEVVWALGGITLLPYILLPLYAGVILSSLSEFDTEFDPDSILDEDHDFGLNDYAEPLPSVLNFDN